MPPTMIQRPGSPSGMRISPMTSAPVSTISASAVTDGCARSDSPFLTGAFMGCFLLCNDTPRDASTGLRRATQPPQPLTAAMYLTVFITLAQIGIPAPRGYLSDFAAFLASASLRHMKAVITAARDKPRANTAAPPPPAISDLP